MTDPRYRFGTLVLPPVTDRVIEVLELSDTFLFGCGFI